MVEIIIEKSKFFINANLILIVNYYDYSLIILNLPKLRNFWDSIRFDQNIMNQLGL